MQLTEQDNFPTLLIDRRFEGHKCLVAGQFAFQPLPSKRTTNEKRNRCADNIAEQRDREAPPETKEKTGADTQYAARQQQHIAARIKERVTDRAPRTPSHHVLLHVGENIDEWKKSAEDEQRDSNHEQRADLQNDGSSQFHHDPIVAGARSVRNSAADCGDSSLRRTDCEHARGKPGSILWFGKGRYYQCAALRHLIKICQELDLIMVRAQNIGLKRPVVL